MGEGVFRACGAKRLRGLDRASAGLHISAVKDRWRKGTCVRETSPYLLLKYGLQRGGHFKDCLEAGVPLIAGIMINTSVNRDADSGNTNERYKPK